MWVSFFPLVWHGYWGLPREVEDTCLASQGHLYDTMTVVLCSGTLQVRKVGLTWKLSLITPFLWRSMFLISDNWCKRTFRTKHVYHCIIFRILYLEGCSVYITLNGWIECTLSWGVGPLPALKPVLLAHLPQFYRWEDWDWKKWSDKPKQSLP
jgi:hypothetical protein